LPCAFTIEFSRQQREVMRKYLFVMNGTFVKKEYDSYTYEQVTYTESHVIRPNEYYENEFDDFHYDKSYGMFPSSSCGIGRRQSKRDFDYFVSDTIGVLKKKYNYTNEPTNVTFDGKNCTRYESSTYTVYADELGYIAALVPISRDDYEYHFNYTWQAPMKQFTLSYDCTATGWQKIHEVPVSDGCVNESSSSESSSYSSASSQTSSQTSSSGKSQSIVSSFESGSSMVIASTILVIISLVSVLLQ